MAEHDRTPRSIYVASSWRNDRQPQVVAELRDAGHDVYDFRNPPSGTGFSWSQVGLEHSNPLDGDPNATDLADATDYLKALRHPRAVAGFASDFDAMQAADTFVLVLPCGRSAHLELGWAVGAGKRTAVLLDDPCTPELMYKMVDYLAPELWLLKVWLDVMPYANESAPRLQGLADLLNAGATLDTEMRSAFGFPPAGGESDG